MVRQNISDMTPKKLLFLFFLFGLGNSLFAQVGTDSVKQIDPVAFDSIIFHFRGSAISSEQYTIILANDTVIKTDRSGNHVLDFEAEMWEGVLPPKDSVDTAAVKVGIRAIKQKAYHIAFELLKNKPLGYIDTTNCLGGNSYRLIFKHKQAGSKSVIWQCLPPPQCQRELEELIRLLEEACEGR